MEIDTSVIIFFGAVFVLIKFCFLSIRFCVSLFAFLNINIIIIHKLVQHATN